MMSASGDRSLSGKALGAGATPGSLIPRGLEAERKDRMNVPSNAKSMASSNTGGVAGSNGKSVGIMTQLKQWTMGVFAKASAPASSYSAVNSGGVASAVGSTPVSSPRNVSGKSISEKVRDGFGPDEGSSSRASPPFTRAASSGPHNGQIQNRSKSRSVSDSARSKTGPQEKVLAIVGELKRWILGLFSKSPTTPIVPVSSVGWPAAAPGTSGESDLSRSQETPVKMSASAQRKNATINGGSVHSGHSLGAHKAKASAGSSVSSKTSIKMGVNEANSKGTPTSWRNSSRALMGSGAKAEMDSPSSSMPVARPGGTPVAASETASHTQKLADSSSSVEARSAAAAVNFHS